MVSIRPRAFVRAKQVGDYTYFQVVRSYRDVDGKVKQQMICHLGAVDSVSSAIDREKRKEGHERQKAEGCRKDASYWYEEVGGEILATREESRPQFEKLEGKRQKLVRDIRYRRLSGKEKKEKWEVLLNELHSSAAIYYLYYRAIDKAEKHEKKANRARSKLNRLREVKQKYEIYQD